MVAHPSPLPRLRALSPPECSAVLSPWVVAGVLTSPLVRPDAVARGRALLRQAAWCRAGEVAHALVGCYLGGRP